ncbi:NADPH_oxidoreductase [Hexamita inflata]|uniref:NADPH oxidoreductase n=1 Tax=Hexamita inflata TaxID=28002 RepID=A0AA86TYB1_9EUKA|nr:NADPH oxidoreductase [Hexamita inflata]
MKTIVVLFHPNPEESVRNKILIDEIKKVKNVTIHVVSGPVQDVEAEKKLLNQYDRIVFQYPIYWFTVPAVGKAYMDAIFSQNGFAGKHIKVVSTTGGIRAHYGDASLFKTIWDAIAPYCGAKLEEQFVFFGDDAPEAAAQLAAQLAE